MTIYLDSGLEIRIPNSQFMTPHVDVNRSGKRIINKSKRELLVNALGNQPPTLGRYFLTAAYLMVNHDANSFTLWQANPTSSSNLVPVYDETAAEECEGSVTGIVQPSASREPSNDGDGDDKDDEDGISADQDDGSQVALIGGAVGGSLGGIAAIAGVVAFFLLRRKHKKRADGAVGGSGADAHPGQVTGYADDQSYKPASYYVSAGGTYEAYGSLPATSELAGDHSIRYELDAETSHGRAL